jgi:GH18 family chitinase
MLMMHTSTLKKIMLVVFLALPSLSIFSQKIIGYATSWSGLADSINYSCITHINYAFALPLADGHLRPLENTEKLQALIQLSHQAGVKVSISVGGWSDENGPLDPVFEDLGANASSRVNLVNDIVGLINTYDLDGADIDWEYPDVGSSAKNYDSLMNQLYKALHPNGKLVTAAVAGDSYNGAGIDLFIKSVTDWINIMGYDYNDYQHSTYSQSIAGVQYFQGKGFPNSQLALGVPFYGRNSWESYAQLVARGADPYADTFNGIGYNGINTIQSKSDYVKKNGLAGIMIWELSQDLNNQYSLVSSICRVFSLLGISNQLAADVKIFPNPAKDFIVISSENKIHQISIYSPQGKTVFQNETDTPDTRIDISHFPPGIYFLELKFNRELAHYKIVKM